MGGVSAKLEIPYHLPIAIPTAILTSTNAGNSLKLWSFSRNFLIILDPQSKAKAFLYTFYKIYIIKGSCRKTRNSIDILYYMPATAARRSTSAYTKLT